MTAMTGQKKAEKADRSFADVTPFLLSLVGALCSPSAGDHFSSVSAGSVILFIHYILN